MKNQTKVGGSGKGKGGLTLWDRSLLGPSLGLRVNKIAPYRVGVRLNVATEAERDSVHSNERLREKCEVEKGRQGG